MLSFKAELRRQTVELDDLRGAPMAATGSERAATQLAHRIERLAADVRALADAMSDERTGAQSP